MLPGASPFVNYDAVAERYASARALGDDALACWRDAVESVVPRSSRQIVVADVGSGTGIFARAWPQWTNARVVGVEPALAMLRSAASSAVPGVSYLRGVAEALPLTDKSVEVAWVSAAFHHFADPARAAQELARVLHEDGRVLLRGVVRDRIRLSWLEAFPGRQRALRRYPTLGQLEALFDDAGLAFVETREVQEPPRTNGERADWIAAMRDADSILTALTNEEIGVGLRALRKRPDEAVPSWVTLTVFG